MEAALCPNNLYIEISDNNGYFSLTINLKIGSQDHVPIYSDRLTTKSTRSDVVIDRLKKILVGQAILAHYHVCKPTDFKSFVKCIRAAGFPASQIGNDALRCFYPGSYIPISLNNDHFNPTEILNYEMILEIVKRLKTDMVVDTFSRPLKSYPAQSLII